MRPAGSDREAAGMLRIFVNYRRADTSGHAGRLYDALSARFGEDCVFMDIDRIEPGLDFAEVINREVGSSDVLLSLIGNQWLSATDAAGNRRLENPRDYVRIEIEAALDRDVRVIPVLVEGAGMPKGDQLPPSLQRLARRNAIELTDTRWRYDVGQLMAVLERLARVKAGLTEAGPARDEERRADTVGGTPAGDAAAAEPGSRSTLASLARRKSLWAGAGLVALAVIGAVIAIVLTNGDVNPSPDGGSFANGRFETTTRTDGASATFQGDAYVLDARPKPLVRPAAAEDVPTSVQVDVNAEKVTGSSDFGLGILCRFRGTDEYYLLGVQSDGTAKITRYVPGRGNRDIRGPVSGARLTGTNHLRALCVGTDPVHLELRVNGSIAVQGDDPTGIPDGTVGLRASSGGGRARVRFRDFNVTTASP